MTNRLVTTSALVKLDVHDSSVGPCDVGSVTTKQKTPLGDRIQELADYYHRTISALSVESYGRAHRSHLQTICNAGSCQLKALIGLYDRTGVDLNWLIMGVGELNRTTLRHPTAKEIAASIAARTKRHPRLSPSGKVRAVPTKDDPQGSKRPRRG
jgi:hypothetical protein